MCIMSAMAGLPFNCSDSLRLDGDYVYMYIYM